MTVAKIKEKINRAIKNSAGERKTTAVRYLLSVLHNINSMLDQLDEWVSVDDRLPDEKGKCYLVTLEFRKDGKWQLQKEETLKHLSINRLLFLRNGKWDVWSDNMRVIAWKPLPKPYERKE